MSKSSEDLDFDEITTVVELIDIKKSYSHITEDVYAVRDVSLKIEKGEFVVITGVSGAGKTTLLNIMGAIDIPDEGTVKLFEVPILDYDEQFRAHFRAAYTGFIFQSYNLISTLNALENVMFPMQLVDKPESEIKSRALELLEKVNLAHRQNHMPWQLSSGEQQRVAIARALANDPPLILADEPTANLDTETAVLIGNIFKELAEAGKTIVLVTHDERLVKMATRHIEMKDGTIVM